MNEVVAVGVGLLASWALHGLYRQWWPTCQRWLPARCRMCGKWQRRGDMVMAQHKVAGWVLVCGDCFAQHYAPWTRSKDMLDN